MNEQTFTFSYTDLASSERAVFLHQLGIVPETVTVGEVADVIDDMFGFTPCESAQDEDSLATETETAPAEEESLDEGWLAELRAFIEEHYSISSLTSLLSQDFNIQCNGLQGQPIRLEFSVHKTHSDIVAKIQTSVSEPVYLETREEQMNLYIDLSNTTSHTIEFNIHSNCTFNWAGQGPEIYRTASTFSWPEKHTGTLEIRFISKFDVYYVDVEGVLDAENQRLDYGCTAIAFYEKRVTTLDLTVPSVTEEDREKKVFLCPDVHIEIDPNQPVKCYNIVREVVYHPCTNEALIYVPDRWVRTSCPPEDTFTPSISATHDGQYHIVSIINLKSFIQKTHPLWNYPGFQEEKDKKEYDSKFFEDTCCSNKPGPPECMDRYGNFYGESEPKPSAEYYRSRYPRKTVAFIPVRPRKEPCGYVHSKYVVEAKNCCADITVTAIEFLADENPDVMADNSTVRIKAFGGVSPYVWTIIEGSPELYFKQGETKVNKITTNDRSVLVYSDDICGTLRIKVEEFCGTSAIYGFRAADGQWILIENRQWDQSDLVPWHDDRSCTFDPGTGIELGDVPINGELYSYTVTSEFSWVSKILHGPYLFEEAVYYPGDINVVNITNTTDCGAGSCGERDPVYSVWPNCAPNPPGTSLQPVCIDWECKFCCAECGDGFLIKRDKYGVITCGTRVYRPGLEVSYRRWYAWVC